MAAADVPVDVSTEIRGLPPAAGEKFACTFTNPDSGMASTTFFNCQFLPKKVTIVVNNASGDSVFMWNDSMPDTSSVAITTAALYSATTGVTPVTNAAVTGDGNMIIDYDGTVTATADDDDNIYVTGFKIGATVDGAVDDVVYVFAEG